MQDLNGERLALGQARATLLARLAQGPMTRIVAYGSSNTERAGHSQGRYNWFDWFDVALRQRYGRLHHVVNAGVCGETTRELLARFDRDVALYQPHVVFITIGGNDSNPAKNLAAAEFRSHLADLVGRLRRLPGCLPVLQTYYSCDLERMGAQHAAQFTEYMQIVRDVADELAVALVDHLARWERLRRHDVAAYRALMMDPMHVTPVGNLLWGLDLARAFGVPLDAAAVPDLGEGLAVQTRLDALAGGAPV